MVGALSGRRLCKAGTHLAVAPSASEFRCHEQPRALSPYTSRPPLSRLRLLPVIRLAGAG
jgi:hypothetical protein